MSCEKHIGLLPIEKRDLLYYSLGFGEIYQFRWVKSHWIRGRVIEIHGNYDDMLKWNLAWDGSFIYGILENHSYGRYPLFVAQVSPPNHFSVCHLPSHGEIYESAIDPNAFYAGDKLLRFNPTTMSWSLLSIPAERFSPPLPHGFTTYANGFNRSYLLKGKVTRLTGYFHYPWNGTIRYYLQREHRGFQRAANEICNTANFKSLGVGALLFAGYSPRYHVLLLRGGGKYSNFFLALHRKGKRWKIVLQSNLGMGGSARR